MRAQETGAGPPERQCGADSVFDAALVGMYQLQPEVLPQPSQT